MKTFNKRLRAILLLIGILVFTVPTFATTADAGADKTLNITPSKRAVYLKGSGTGEEPLTYKWYEDGRFIGRGAGRWYVITKSGEHNITLVVRDANGSSATDTMVVTVNKATANAGEDQESNSTLVHLSGSGTGKAPLKYKWYEKGHFIGEGQSYDYNISQNGQHEITLVVTDANGAKAKDKVVVTINSGVDTPLTANAGPDKTLNITPSNRAVHLKGSGTGKAPLTYKWYESGKFIGTGASRWYGITKNGQYKITLVVADVDGNEANDTMVVTVNNGEPISKNQEINITCDRAVFYLRAEEFVGEEIGDSPLTYRWYDNGIFIGSGTHRWYVFTQNGRYEITLIAVDVHGNTTRNTIIFNVNIPNLNDGLVAHYEFEGNANDSSGNENNGTEHGGVSYVDGVIGKAGSFDGVDDWIKINHIKNITNTDNIALTFSLWLNLNSNIYGVNQVFEAHVPSGEFFLEGDTIQKFESSPTEAISTDILDTDKWINIILVFDGEKKEKKIYVNGILNKKIDISEQHIKLTTGLTIGRDFESAIQYLNAKIDDLRIYNRALCETEIKTLYNLGNNEINSSKIKKTGQTISYYPKDDGDYQKGVTPSYTRDDEKEIVTDNITKLQWQDDEEAKTIYKNWQDARDYCSNLNLGGYTDWRLPSVVELQSIVVDGKYNPAIDTTVFVNYASSFYWSSTTYASYTYNAWEVNFNKAYTFNYYKLYDAFVRCVREGQ